MIVPARASRGLNGRFDRFKGIGQTTLDLFI
jgi:hypothetical protein